MSQTLKWWQTGVVYQIYPRSFKDATGNGIGDLVGIIEKLDYFKDRLPVDAIWLSPFYPSPMADFGYDVSNYVDVHPLFGDLAIFDRLVQEIHSRDLKIIIDFVPNHSSDQHPWFKASRSSRNHEKRDWYIWKDAKPDGSPPNNWVSVFGGSAWEWDADTDQYYLHSFLKEQPDLNWRNPDVKEAMFDSMRFWLDREVDGFRIDVAHHLLKDPQFRDNPPADNAAVIRHKEMGDFDTQVHLYDAAHPDIHELFKEFRTLFDAYSTSRPRFSVGEIHDFNWESWASYYGEKDDGLHMPFNFLTLAAPWTADGIRQIVESMEQAIPAHAWPNYVLGNHDEQRLSTRYGSQNVRLAAMLLLTLRGTPTLYYGDELGMVEGKIPPDMMQDPWGKAMKLLGRDGCRTPMQWDDSAGAGFSTSNKPWLPVNPDATTRNVATQVADPESILNLYKRLLVLRKSSDALKAGSYTHYKNAPKDCFGFIRSFNDEQKLVLLNFSDTAQSISFASPQSCVLSTHVINPGPANKNFNIDAKEGLVFDLS